MIYHFQAGHYAHYIFCFYLGIMAYRGKWLENLTESQGKLWGSVSIVIIAALPLWFGTFQAIGIPVEAVKGGISWEALIYNV